MEDALQLWNFTRKVKIKGDITHSVKKIANIGNHLYLLGSNQFLYHGVTQTFEDIEILYLEVAEGFKLIDIDCCSKFLYAIDDCGRVWKYTEDLEVINEIKLIEDAKTCVHGHMGAKRKLKVEKISVGQYGVLFVTDSGQLWASGNMHQIRINSDVPKKVQFFEGRYVYNANVGDDFAIAIVSKQTRGDDTDSDECDEDVFVLNCPKCRSTSQLTSPISLNSLSETCGLGVPIQASYDIETTSTSSKNSGTSSNDKKIETNELPNENGIVTSTEQGADKTEKNIVFRNTEAAKEFLTKQFSWISASEEYFVEYSQKPTTIIKENITNMASLVYEGVKTVGDKVVTLSRHVSGSSENNDAFEVMEETHLPRITSKDEFTWSLSQGTSERDLSEHGLQERVNIVLKNGSNLLNCEVWTWGNIIHGQLGLGDIIKRDRPVIIAKLSNVGAHKLSVQSYHAAVLTLDGRAFLWGRNNHHQVTTECDRDQSSPKLFPTDADERTKDVVCGSYHTSLLSTKFVVQYIGKNADKVITLHHPENQLNCQISESSSNNSNNNLTEESLTTNLLSSSQYTLSNQVNYNNSYITEDLVYEQKFLEEMLTVQMYLIKPLQKKNFAINDSNLYETLCRTYSELLNFTAANIHSLLEFSNKLISDCDIIMFKCIDEHLFIYKTYLNTLHSVISINGCNYISKIVELHQSLYKLDGVTVSKKDKNSEEQVIFTLLTKPFLRLYHYEAIVRNFLQYTEKVQRFNEILTKWLNVIDEQQNKKLQAEATKLFWVNSGKSLELFKTPNRRLIRESHTNPLFLQNAGRFSSHWFILLTDILIHLNGSNPSIHQLPVIWVEPQQEENSSQYQICLKMPEETLILYTNDPEHKIGWLHDLQTAIKNALDKPNAHQPPLVRTASYTFTKSGFLKDAKYSGRWANGLMNGSGKLEWPDGKVYVGLFSRNQLHGFGRMDIPNSGIYEGQWKDNLQNGFGIFKYTNGDVYKGYFKGGLPHGHGCFKQGHFMTSNACIYIGDWDFGSKNGYGVLDDIVTGEKYLGNWADNKKHGNGIIVTSDGIYYEGVFNQDILTGHGLMILEDGTHYEGEFKGTGFLNGKGVLTLTSGQTIEGTLSGSWNDGIKINGTLMLPKNHHQEGSNTPKNFGKSCTPMKQKWKSLFRHCYQILGIPEKNNGKGVDVQKIWQNVAVVVANSNQGTLRKKVERNIENFLNNLDIIPQFCRVLLDKNGYCELQQYLPRAFECPYHPLGSLLSDLTVAYTTTYGGLRAHPLLLSHAVDELHSISERLYEIVRLLFPALPHYGDKAHVDENDEDSDTISCESLLYPIILPKVHSSLFILYTLRNKPQENQYWKRLLEWNKHSDYTLMAFLSVDQKFLKSTSGPDQPVSPSISSIKDQTFMEAVETLQLLKTTFSPLEKLRVIRGTFQKMTEVVQQQLGPDYRWNMDDLFPVFLYVVVRARILQLGSELDFINDFMEPSLENGELGIMFTTLKACYHQILQEKISIT